MNKDKTKGTSVLARARLRRNKAGSVFGGDHSQFSGKVVKTSGKTQVYFGDTGADLGKTR